MTKTYKILYAEDDISLNEITTELLTGEGFESVSVANGHEAQQRLGTEEFDLLLSDFQMPHVNGAELLIWCRKMGKHLPILFVSGNLERLPIETMALGDCCSSILTKPVAIDDLIKAILHAVTRSHDVECFKIATHEDTLTSEVFLGQHHR